MANTSAIVALSNAVRQFIALQGLTGISVGTTGWRQRTQQLNQGAPAGNRILFIPGNPQGQDGPLTRGRTVSANPRALLQWDRSVVMSVWAYDGTAPDSEEAQISAVEYLLELAIQGIHRGVDPATKTPIGVANIEWGRVQWTVANQEMALGREVLVDFVMKAVFFDLPYGVATPGAAINRDPVP